MSELFDEKGNLQIPLEGITERLMQRVSQLTLEVATLQTANGILTEELKKLKGSEEISKILADK